MRGKSVREAQRAREAHGGRGDRRRSRNYILAVGSSECRALGVTGCARPRGEIAVLIAWASALHAWQGRPRSTESARGSRRSRRPQTPPKLYSRCRDLGVPSLGRHGVRETSRRDCSAERVGLGLACVASASAKRRERARLTAVAATANAPKTIFSLKGARSAEPWASRGARDLEARLQC